MMSKLLITLVIVALATVEASSDNYARRMLDEIGEFGADTKALGWLVVRIDRHLEEIGISPASSTEEILDKLAEYEPEVVEDPKLHQALKVLLRLKASTGDCYMRTRDALAEAYLLIGGEPRELFKTNSTVTSYVLRISQEHQKRCLPQYSNLYEAEVAKIDKSVVQELENLFDNEYFGSLRNAWFVEEMNFHDLVRSVYNSIDNVVNQLKKTQEFKVWQRGVVGTMLCNNKKKDPEFYREYLVSRCQTFNDYLGTVFAPAHLDSRTFNASPMALCKSAGAKFCQHWKIYRVCLAHLVIDGDGNLIQRMKRLGKPVKYYYGGFEGTGGETKPSSNGVNPVLFVALLG